MRCLTGGHSSVTVYEAVTIEGNESGLISTHGMLAFGTTKVLAQCGAFVELLKRLFVARFTN